MPYVMCGNYAPEGTMVCYACQHRAYQKIQYKKESK